MSSAQACPGSAAIIPILERRPEDVVETVSERDDLLDAGLANYLHHGVTALVCIRAALALAGVKEVRSVLDFACGYGRVLRTLRAEFPNAEMVACDLDRETVDFCCETFDVHGIYATDDPQDIPMDSEFDLIWCGSLLTHASAERWAVFLDFFASHLTPGGVVVFTTHGRQIADVLSAKFAHQDEPHERRPPYNLLPDEVLQLLKGFREAGFAYQKYPLHEEYGFSLSRPDWVAGCILGQPSLRLVLLTESGWGGHQDMVACLKIEG